MTKRSGRWANVTINHEIAAMPPPGVDVLDLDDALTPLAEFDQGRSQIAELRFFTGLTPEETGHVLCISVATVERDWQVARAWLYAALKGKQP